ncbi:hypothetical protein [Streptomyces sp. adm13(2018)]|uniref:hypothetical protein n=1 Tax=Streptomyces sp. adm13(2018) TaxID=2479007 RepID=UPI001650682C|nr:hypothetical protein [Streptomyces sp. adm13(2018)]
MSERLTFTLEGRDQLSRILGHAGDSAERLRRSMEDASDGSGQAILTLTQDADGRLRDLEGRFISTADAAALMGHRTGEASRPVADWSRVADEASRAGAELRASLISLLPAAIPMAAAIAPIAASTAAAGAGLAVFGLAAGRQVAAMTEAAEAEKKYTDAVAQSGARSQEAAKAQVAYAKHMATLPPATREAAAALSVFKDAYADWSDSLAADTTAPLIKGMGTLQGIFPKLTPSVKGASEQLDRVVTLAGGGVASPGFDAFMAKFDTWTTGALTRATDGLVHLLRVTSEGDGGGLGDFMDWARQQGPAVSATLQDLGRALLNVLEAGAEVGVGMLDVVQVLSRLVSAVPPEALTTMLQLAIAIKAVSLAVAGASAAKVAMAAFGAQIMTMRAAAAGAPGPLAAAGAAITGLSRTAKIALAGTGIGLLVIALTELSQAGKEAPPDVDKLTGSLKELGSTGRVTGEAARAFGSDLSGLYDKVRSLTDPSTTDQVQQWIVTLGGLGSWDSTPVKEGKENLDAVDKALAGMVSSGNADLAAAALRELTAQYGEGGRDTAQFTQQLDDYEAAIADAAFEQRLAAQAMGLFGDQAVATQQKLDAQKMAADGLRQSIHALNQAHLIARGGIRGMEAAIDAASEAVKNNGATLDNNTAKGRANNQALDDLANATMKAVEAKYEETGSWSQSMAIYDRGRGQLVALATQMTGNEQAAKKLADQILRTPNKTAMLKGNLEDLQAKLADAKKRLASVPDSKKAAIRAEISQLEAQVSRAKGAIASVQGKTVSVMVQYRTSHSGASDFTKSIGGYAGGGSPRPGETFWVGEDGPELMTLGRGGGARVYDHRTSMSMVGQAGAGQDAGAGLVAGMLGSRAGVEQAARGMAAGVEAGVRAELQIASPSKKMMSLMKDVRDGIIRGLTGSKSQIQATAADLNSDIWKAWEGQKTAKDSNLVKLVNREHDKLQRLASKRDALASKITNAQNLLKSRISEQANYRASVRSTAQGASSLSSLGLEQKEVTAGSIRAGLQQKLVKVRQFNRYITMLAKKGLNKNLLRQLLAMGPEEGFAYAAALAGMTGTEFKQVNSIQKQLDTEADSLGRTGAKTLYDAGVNSAKGLVQGLQSQQTAIEKQMLAIAKGMERAIKKALGIKSPSVVGQAIGLNFGQSIGGGALASLPTVGRAVDAVAERMAGMRPSSGRPAAGVAAGAAAGAAQVNNWYVQTLEPGEAARAIQKVLLADKRASGGVSRGF